MPLCDVQAPAWRGDADHARACHLEGQP
jgi:hypothetical protein